MISLKEKKLFLFDLDGVFYKGKENPIRIGGIETIKKIRDRGKKMLILTNDSTDTAEKIQKNLESLKIEVRKEEILTSGMLAADYAVKRFGKGAKYFLVGEKGLGEELDMAGLKPARSADSDVVIVGLDRELTYEKLEAARQAVVKGAEIIATHKAKVYMYRDGPALAVGPIVAAIEYATGKKATSIGKPSVIMFRLALKNAGCARQDAVMVGDQLDTDILGANRARIESILVRTGVFQRGQGKIKPSAILGNVDDLARYI
jgi:HAD superfamily hydrolase (TIGR01450 family)